MRVNGPVAMPEPADLPLLFGMVQAKLEAAGISLRDALLLPVTPDGLAVLAGCLATPGNEALEDNTWLPGKPAAPLGPKTKHVVFLAGKTGSSQVARAAKQFLQAYSKQLKLGKVLRVLTFHLACFFTSVPNATLGDGIRQVAAIKCPSLDAVRFFAPATGDPVTVDEAASKLSWEMQFTLLEQHEAVLDKLKSELWS